MTKRPLPRAFLDRGPANAKSLVQKREDEQHYVWSQTKSSRKVVKTMNQCQLRLTAGESGKGVTAEEDRKGDVLTGPGFRIVLAEA